MNAIVKTDLEGRDSWNLSQNRGPQKGENNILKLLEIWDS